LDYQPRPGVRAENNHRDRLIRLAAQHPAWVLGFVDEVWWSRLAQPNLPAWAPAERAVRLVAKPLGPHAAEPKARACYGGLLRATPTLPEQIWLRFAQGQPVSGRTTQFLA